VVCATSQSKRTGHNGRWVTLHVKVDHRKGITQSDEPICEEYVKRAYREQRQKHYLFLGKLPLERDMSIKLM
jgi:hypothetical protein